MTPVRGCFAIAERLLTAFTGLDLRFEVTTVNSEPGVFVTRQHRVVAVLTFVTGDRRISALHAVGNPNKLRHLRFRPERRGRPLNRADPDEVGQRPTS